MSIPARAELKHVSKHWTQTGCAYDDEYDLEEDISEHEIPSDAKYTLCVAREYDKQNRRVMKTTLQVHSEALQAILRSVIDTHPGESFHPSDISIDFAVYCLYHYRTELKRALAE